jgi:alpha,alpha-trehalase
LRRSRLQSAQSNRLPRPLPDSLLPEKALEHPLLLCLDYDGTISEIAPDPASAVLYEGVRGALDALAGARDKVAVAIVSGRTVAELERLVQLQHQPFFSGIHGLEYRPTGRNYRYAPQAQAHQEELGRVREWLSQNVPADRGFLVEDKHAAIALHYRNADAALAAKVTSAFISFVEHNAPGLRLLDGKKIAEVLPREAGKHQAVELLMREIGASRLPVYFGDDVTDEDAFAALDGSGIGILVGKPRPSLAQYFVEGPAQVAEILDALARAIGAVPVKSAPDARDDSLRANRRCRN